MTVGIAVLCENAKTAVMIADRLVGYGNLGIDTDCVKLTNPAPGLLAVFRVRRHPPFGRVRSPQTPTFRKQRLTTKGVRRHPPFGSSD